MEEFLNHLENEAKVENMLRVLNLSKKKLELPANNS